GRKPVSKKILQRVVIPHCAKPAENQWAAAGDLHRRQRRAHVLGGHAKELRALRNANRLARLIVAPVMKAADDRPVALVGIAQRKRAMRAAVFERAQLAPKT